MAAARVFFEQELNELNGQLVTMAKQVDEAIGRVIDAFRSRDGEAAKAVIAGDRTVNDMEKSIETKSLSLILRQQPVAKDLRIISTALKVVTDMERIGDHAADIAELVLRLFAMDEKAEKAGEQRSRMIQHIPQMADAARGMVHDAVEAFIAMDVDSAQEIIARDDVVDNLFNQVKEDIINDLKAGTVSADYCIDYLMIAKYLERIGDHAVNICEWTQFHETGSLQNVRLL